MANLAKPTETLVFKISTFRRHQIANAKRDGHIDETERSEIDMLDRILEFAVETHEREQLADHIRKGGDPSAYMNRMAHRIGMKITALEEQRGRVVAFPHQQHG